MKYTIELTDNQKKQMDLLCEIAHQHIGFNPRLEKDIPRPMKESPAYKKGFEDGKLWAIDENAKAHQEYYDNGYYKGLDDACLTAWTLLTSTNTGKIFTEYGTVSDILGNVPMKEIRNRIKAYEEKKKAEKEIRVGDEVETKSRSKGIVSYIYERKTVDVLFSDGSTGKREIESLSKTGRNFSNEVKQLLNKLRGE